MEEADPQGDWPGKLAQETRPLKSQLETFKNKSDWNIARDARKFG